MLLALSTVHAQTLVNRAWKTTTGNPKESINHLAGAATTGYVVLVGNTFTLGQKENFLITKYNFSGQILWQTEYSTGDTISDMGLDVYIQGNHIYVTGASMATDLSTADITTLKLDADSGDIIWDTTYAGSYGGIDMAAATVVDSLGNTYVLGSEQNSLIEAALVLIKYNSAGQQQWVMHYDSTGLIDGGGALALAVDGSNVIVSGFSGSAFSSWHFVTLTVDAATGSIASTRYSPNANGGLYDFYGVTQDYEGNLFILGSTLHSPGNTDLKLIKYDMDFNEEWVQVWGNPDSTNDAPGTVIIDAQGDVIVAGYAGNGSGGTDMLTLRYTSVEGDLLWQRRLSAPDASLSCAAYDAVSAPPGSDGPVYLTGSVSNGTNLDYITASYDLQGNLRWLKTMHDTLNSNDEGRDIQFVNGGVIVSGMCNDGTNTRYVSVKYEEFIRNTVAVIDTDSIPQYIDDEVIVWFNPNKVDSMFCADKNKTYTNLGKLIIDTNFLAEIDTLLGANGRLNAWKVHKVFQNLTPDVKYSISRRGDTVIMPQYWSCFVLHLPPGHTVNEVVDSLKTVGFEGILEVQRNNTYIFDDAASDEAYQDDFQRSLRPSILEPTLANSSINIEGAWDIETGRSHVKVGVYDSGINFHHRAFGDGTLTGSNIIGYNYVDRQPILESDINADLDQISGHGTSCAGIIGAQRNDSNLEGIAGIAGGNVNGSGVGDANQGIQLVSMCVGKNTGTCDNSIGGIIPESEVAPAVVEGASYTNTGYGFGLNVMNMSFGRPKATDEDRPMFKNAISIANRNQVTICASSGNHAIGKLYAVTDLHFPATVDKDDWVICVGASGSNGYWKGQNVNDEDLRNEVCTNDAYNSMYGRNVDIIAPGITGLVWTARADGNNNTGYKGFNGTSAAAPHASGVAALIISHLNSENINGNVAPEDVENILQLSADDIDVAPASVGEDAATGFGRINATNALELIKLPHRQLKHLPYTATTSSRSSTELTSGLIYGSNISIGGITRPVVVVAIHEVEITYNHSGELTGAATLVNGWRRNSASEGMITYGFSYLLNGDYKNFGCEQIGSIDENNVSFRTYIFEIKQYYDPNNGWQTLSSSVWFPKRIEDATCTYTLLVEDLTATDIEKAPEDDVSVRLTPNPTEDKAFLRYVLPENASTLRIDVYDINGKVIRNIFNGQQNKGVYSRELNVADLSSGLYFVHLYSENFSVTKKLNKQ